MGPGILEREAELAVLAEAAASAGRGSGSVVLVFGEAGIGKSSLVEALRGQLPAAGRMLVGYCDDLATPRTLGPFRDLAGSVGTELGQALADGGDRDRLLAALRAELDWRDRPTVLVVEDVHWADDATLDVLRFLARRIAGLPAALVLTYRDDELGRGHALHGLLGQVSRGERVRRLPLQRLSAGAVSALSTGTAVSADDLYALTAGNPFFVSELLVSSQGNRVPPSIADAVLARVRRLDPATQDLLEQLSVVPAALERWLVDALAAELVPDPLAALAAAEQGGLLNVSPRRICFRHELTRRAIEGAVPAARLMALNQRVLDVLRDRPEAEVAQLVHHAARAGDAAAIAAYGPAAARDAARAGAHREAVSHFRLVLEQASRFSVCERADLVQEYAIESYTIGAAAAGFQRQAVDLNRSLGDPCRVGASLRWLSRMHWLEGDRADAERAGREAVEVLEQAGDGGLLALALSNQSQLLMLQHRAAEAVEHGERAVILARQAGDLDTTSHALCNIGTAQWFLRQPAAHETLDAALRIALDAGDAENACRAYANMTWNLLDWFRLDEAESYLTDAVKFAEQAEFLGFLSYLQAAQARLEFARSRWDGVTRLAGLGRAGHPQARCPALTLLGWTHVRRGEPGADGLLTEARELAVQMDELQRLAPVAAALAEAAWLRGDHAAARAAARPAYELARELGDHGSQAELGYRLGRSGQQVPVPGDHPYAVQAAGRWQDAAAAFEAAGSPYERAAALAQSPDPGPLLTALEILDDLGARPLAALVRDELRARGVTRIPRGPAPGTRANPARLTARQADVLRQLGQGRTNAQIASELVVSVRTVDSHVAALLAKLGARDRRAAVIRAAELGMLDAGDQ
jgi:DNA-binding CsgD family transcriptional regulator/tetratricopeptide (TPR) repeat protein/energy-coupling factor transporter ATP-binding protein EcfA2